MKTSIIKVQGYGIEFQAAALAGLTLAGADEYGTPEWLGNTKQWNIYKQLLDQHDRT